MADQPYTPTEREIDTGPWVDCWQCGGHGALAGCFEDTCVCGAEDDPDECCAPSRCDICCGEGGWFAAAKARGE